MKSSSEHWDSIFRNTEDPKLGWYEKDSSQTFRLLSQIPDWENSRIFLPGAGTSVIIDRLLAGGARLILNDISQEALSKVKRRVGNKSDNITWLCRDIARPAADMIAGVDIRVDIWIDRAVLHFLTDEDDIRGYFNNVRSILKSGGYAIFAEFTEAGAAKCAGLTLHRYSIEELSERLGPSFKLITDFEHTYINPFGSPRPYIYALFKSEIRE